MTVKINKTIRGKNLNIAFNKDDKSLLPIERYIPHIINKLRCFYQIKSPKINIEFIYSREEFNDKLGYKTPDWLVAATQNNHICLFSPSVIEQLSIHKKAEIRKILAHEFCHVFNSKINNNNLMWIDEGVALFLARQRRMADFGKKDMSYFANNYFDKNIGLLPFAENNGYKISYWAIKKAIESRGKNIILKLLRIDPEKKKCRDKLEYLLGDSIKDIFKIRN